MSLPLPMLLAVRYLRSTRRDSYVSFLSTLASGGIALGVAALILVLSGLAGLQNFLRSDVLARTPHLEIELPVAALPEADAAALVTTLSAVEGVVEVRRMLRGRGWLLSGNIYSDVRVVGFEGELPEFFPRSVEQQEASLERGIFLGAGMAARWGLEIGQQVELVSPRPTLTPFGPKPRLRNLRVAGLFDPGKTEDKEVRVAVPLDIAERLFGSRQGRLEVRTSGLEDALGIAPALVELLPQGARLQTWKDLNRGLFFALELERMLMFISVFLIVPVAAMALVTVLALLISSKRSEIAMLHAMGTTPKDLERTFLGLGALLGGIGLSIGALLGIGGAWLLDHYRLLSPPGDVYFIDHIPFLVRGDDLLWILGATVLFTGVSTWYAARRASALQPVEALTAP